MGAFDDLHRERRRYLEARREVVLRSIFMILWIVVAVVARDPLLRLGFALIALAQAGFIVEYVARLRRWR